MSQSLVLILLALALLLPLVGAIVLRLLAPRLAPAQLGGIAAVIFGVAFGSVITLALSNLSTFQVAGLTVLQSDAPIDPELDLPPLTLLPEAEDPFATEAPLATVEVIASPTREPATSIPETPTPEPTITPIPETPTPEPTITPIPETPTPEPPTATAVPAGPRTYAVQPGDTLRSIAEQFGVSVQAILDANDLTPQEADSLRVGQELIIP